MSQRNGSHLLFAAAIGFLVLWGYAGLAAAQQLPLLLPAQRAPHEAIKVDVRPTARAYHVGQVVQMEVTLRDPGDHAVPSRGRTAVEVSEIDPAHNTTTRRVIFNNGERIEHFQFPANQQGVYRIIARQAYLRQGSYVILVKPPPQHPHRLARGVWRSAVERPSGLRPVVLRWDSAEPPQLPGGAPPANGLPKLMLEVPDQGHEFLADGIDPALIQVFYMDPNGNDAPRDIRVWLTWSNGVLDPRPLVIREGESWGEASLRSRWPVDAHIRIVSSSPHYDIVGTTEYTVKFGPPIYGVAAVVPKKLPLVDTGTVTAQLLGPGNVPVNADRNIPVTFTLDSPRVRLASTSKDIEIKKDTSAVSISLVPLELGEAELKVSIPNRPTETYPIRVTGLAVILLCLAGGVIGGVCAFDAFKGSLFWRIFLGIVGGAVLTWLYVFVGLPQMSWTFAHNVISALFVSILGGFMGLHVLNLAAKRLGLMREQPKS